MTGSRPLDEDERFAAGLASLGAGPRVLRRFLEELPPPDAWEALARGRHPADVQGTYRDKARAEVLETVVGACERGGVSVLVRGSPGYPVDLADDPEAPAVLFAVGHLGVCDGAPRVTVVGTRSATPYGLGIASEFGQGLAEAGVVVVSGLARGIDTAAHSGAVAARGAAMLGVLGTAPDAPVARSQGYILQGVASNGMVISEIPPGSPGVPAWRFVVRNRVMAALAHVVVVVECHARGGALHTVKAAVQRGVPVTAVPGSVRSAASAGTNALLADGASVVRDLDDVIAALELAVAGRPSIRGPRRVQGRPAQEGAGGSLRGGRGGAPNAPAAKVLRALDQDPAPLDTVVRRSGLSLGEVALALEQLAESGLVASEGGWWSRPRR
jgi:DNA processing protein